MIADAEKRRASASSSPETQRFGSLRSYQLGSWLNRLRTVGVRVQGIAGSVRDPYCREGKLLLALEQDRQESVRLSMRTLSGQRETASKGLRAGGKIPYGYARRRRRLDGTTELVAGSDERRRDKAEVVELVAGDASEVEVIRSIFSCARNGDGYATIAVRLNERGIPSPDAPRRTVAHRAGRWTYGDRVRALLLNPRTSAIAIWELCVRCRSSIASRKTRSEVDEFEATRSEERSRGTGSS